MIKHFFLITTCALFSNFIYAQNIEPMMCEGKLPNDLKKTLSDIINNKNTTEFSKNNLLGIYEIFASGNVVFGNKAWQMVNAIGQKVIQSNHLDTNVNFYILRSGFYNAFATDEGYVFATTGLLSQVRKEDELAFVLCHELSHYVLKHNLQRNEKAKESLKKKMDHKRESKNDSLTEDAKYNTLDAYLKEFYKFSRLNEFQADSLGLIFYRNAGYNPDNVLPSVTKLQYAMPLFYENKYNPQLLEPSADVNLLNQLTNVCMGTESFNNITDITFKFIKDTLTEDFYEDSLYSSHPEWADRYRKLNDLLKKQTTGTTVKNTLIEQDLRFDCLSESFLTQYKDDNYLSALAYLLIMEESYGSSSNLQQWKGICLSSLYLSYFKSGIDIAVKKETLSDTTSFINGLLRHLLTWNRGEMEAIAYYYNSKYTQSEDIRKINNFYLNKLGPDLAALSLKETKDSVEFMDCDTIKTYISIQRPFLKLVKDEIKNYDSSKVKKTWNHKEFTAQERDESSWLFMGDVPPPRKYRSPKTDSMILVSPNLLVYPGEYTRKFSNPLYSSKKKAFFSREIIDYGKKNDMYYTNLDYDNKLNLTTEAYNEYFFSIAIISELINGRESDNCPISVLYADRIIAQTKCTKMQFMQLAYYNNRPNAHTGTIILEALLLPFSFVSTRDLGGILPQFYSNTKILNIVVDLKEMNIDFVAFYQSSLK